MRSLAVASRSFSKNQELRNKVLEIYPDAKFNDDGKSLYGKGLIDFLGDSERAITALEKIDEDILCSLPNLKVIGKYGVGLDMIDLKAMHKYGVKLGWQGGVNKRSVSELVISSSISLMHKAVFANNEVKLGKWYQVKGSQITNKVFGIIGCGHIGKDLVKLLQPFQCKILANDILDFPEFYQQYNVQPVEIDYLLENSDVISIHLPLDNSTKHILNKQKLDLIKQTSILINLARGGLVDESVLKEKLQKKEIAGAAIDVFEIEPPENNDFALLDNVLVTPHIGGSTEEAILAMGVSAIEGLRNAKDPLSFL